MVFVVECSVVSWLGVIWIVEVFVIVELGYDVRYWLYFGDLDYSFDLVLCVV